MILQLDRNSFSSVTIRKTLFFPPTVENVENEKSETTSIFISFHLKHGWSEIYLAVIMNIV